jgi:hypothetical protein
MQKQQKRMTKKQLVHLYVHSNQVLLTTHLADSTLLQCGIEINGLCTRHKTVAIHATKAGLGELASSYVQDMYSIIYHDKGSEEALSAAFADAKLRYGHNDCSRTYIENLEKKKNKFCTTYMKHVFTHGHVTTQRVEGTNDRIKGHGDLDLSKATLVEMHERVNRVNRENYRYIVNELARLRQRGARVSEFYRKRCEQSIGLCAINITSCENLPCGKYRVTKKDGSISIVNLAHKIIHRGKVFYIAQCTCSYWMSTKIHCQCIVRCITESCDDGKAADIFNVKLIHPLFHLQRSPLWQLALQKAKMENYDDGFGHDNTPSLHSGSDMDGSMVPISSRANNTDDVYVIPSKFYNDVGTVPKSEASRVNEFRQAAKRVETCVGRGDGEVYTMAIARMLQLENELNGVIDSISGEGMGIREPQTKKAAKAARKEDKNRSSLHFSNRHTMSKQNNTQGTNNNKRRKQQMQSRHSGCYFCKQIDQYKTNRNVAGYVPIRVDHHDRDCPRMEEYGRLMDFLEAQNGLKSENGGVAKL